MSVSELQKETQKRIDKKETQNQIPEFPEFSDSDWTPVTEEVLCRLSRGELILAKGEGGEVALFRITDFLNRNPENKLLNESNIKSVITKQEKYLKALKSTLLEMSSKQSILDKFNKDRLPSDRVTGLVQINKLLEECMTTGTTESLKTYEELEPVRHYLEVQDRTKKYEESLNNLKRYDLQKIYIQRYAQVKVEGENIYKPIKGSQETLSVDQLKKLSGVQLVTEGRVIGREDLQDIIRTGELPPAPKELTKEYIDK